MVKGLERFPGTIENEREGCRMTIKDIAALCGVSVSTVSRVLNDHPDVSEANRQRVLAAVREHHYVPNSAARDLVRPPMDAVGVVVRGAGNPFFSGIIGAIEQAICAAGYTMVLHQIRSGEDELAAAADLIRSKRLRGVIMLGGCFDYTREQVAVLGVPFVLCTYTNSFGDLPGDSYSSVTIDDRREAFRAVSHLLEQGHRTVGVVLDSVCDRSISQLRLLGYRQALEGAGIRPEDDLVCETGSFDLPSAYEGVGKLLERRPDLTALFVISDSMAVAAIKALHDRGRRVPEDCSVVAIDGIDLSAYVVPTLTTLVQPQKELGESAVKLLTDLLEERSGHRHLVVNTTLRPGGSVASL